jgi:hypothetical protein
MLSSSACFRFANRLYSGMDEHAVLICSDLQPLNAADSLNPDFRPALPAQGGEPAFPLPGDLADPEVFPPEMG